MHNDPVNIPPLSLLIGDLNVPDTKGLLAVKDTCMTTDKMSLCDIRMYEFNADMAAWIAQNLTSWVAVVMHCEPVRNSKPSNVYLWQTFKFANERDLMIFKLFWS